MNDWPWFMEQKLHSCWWKDQIIIIGLKLHTPSKHQSLLLLQVRPKVEATKYTKNKTLSLHLFINSGIPNHTHGQLHISPLGSCHSSSADYAIVDQIDKATEDEDSPSGYTCQHFIILGHSLAVFYDILLSSTSTFEYFRVIQRRPRKGPWPDQ